MRHRESGRSNRPCPIRSSRACAVLGIAVSVLSLQAAADTGRLSGKDVVDAVCITCHGTGVSGAPKIGDEKAWKKRASRGLGGLTKNALAGIRKMPAHGGQPGLTDLEIERAVAEMVNRSGGHWVEPVGAKDLRGGVLREKRGADALARERALAFERPGRIYLIHNTGIHNFALSQMRTPWVYLEGNQR